MENETVVALRAVIDALDRHLTVEERDIVEPHVAVLAALVHRNSCVNDERIDDDLTEDQKMPLRMKAIEDGRIYALRRAQDC